MSMELFECATLHLELFILLAYALEEEGEGWIKPTTEAAAAAAAKAPAKVHSSSGSMIVAKAKLFCEEY